MAELDNTPDPQKEETPSSSLLGTALKSAFNLANKLADLLGGRPNETDRVLLLISRVICGIILLNLIVLITLSVVSTSSYFQHQPSSLMDFLILPGLSLILIGILTIPAIQRAGKIEEIRALEMKMDLVLAESKVSG